jgi:hypothetical protein
MNGRQHAEALLLLTQRPEEVRRTHVWRPGGQTYPDAILGLTVPLAVKRFDAFQPLFCETGLQGKRSGLADTGQGAVPGAFAKL